MNTFRIPLTEKTKLLIKQKHS